MIVPIVIARSNSFSLQKRSKVPLPHCDALTCPDGTPCSRWAAQRRCPPTLLAPQPGGRTLRNQFDFPAGFFQCDIRLTWSHIFLLAFFLARIRALYYIFVEDFSVLCYCFLLFSIFVKTLLRWVISMVHGFNRTASPSTWTGIVLVVVTFASLIKKLCTLYILYWICFAKSNLHWAKQWPVPPACSKGSW